MVITFDDGFADNYKYALPILRERNLPATVFLVGDATNNRTLLWMHRLAYLVNTRGAERVLDAAILAQSGPAVNGRPLDTNLRWLREHLTCNTDPSARDRLLDVLCEEFQTKSDILPDGTALYLTEAELEEMRASGITFGCHGATHTAFAAMCEAEQEAELSSTWQIVSPWAQGGPPPLAYPFGEPRHYTKATQRLAQEVGHRCLLAAGGGMVSAASRLDELDRIKVEEEPLAQFAARLEGIGLRSWVGDVTRLSRWVPSSPSSYF